MKPSMKPVLTHVCTMVQKYGAMENITACDNIQMRAMNFFLRVPRKAPNVGV